MIELNAPHPNMVTTIRLPNPQLGDTEGLTINMDSKRAMDGCLYTYIKTNNDNKKIIYNFILTRAKGEELKRFLLEYSSNKIRMVDHLSREWLGYFVNNPFSFTTIKKASPGGENELMDITIEFEGNIQ